MVKTSPKMVRSSKSLTPVLHPRHPATSRVDPAASRKVGPTNAAGRPAQALTHTQPTVGASLGCEARRGSACLRRENKETVVARVISTHPRDATVARQASRRQRNRPRPARFAAVFGALAVSVMLYQGANHPWGPAGGGADLQPALHVRRQMQAASACTEEALPRKHKSFLTGDDKTYKCGIDELGELFTILATKESCLIDCASGTGQCATAATKTAIARIPGYGNLPDGKDFPVAYDIAGMIDSKNKLGADKTMCTAASGTYTPATIDTTIDASLTDAEARFTAYMGAASCTGTDAGTCTVTGSGTNTNCADANTESACTKASTAAGVTGAANACVFTGHTCVFSVATPPVCPAGCKHITAAMAAEWRNGMCNLMTETNRDSPGAATAGQLTAVFTAMKEWDTHDDKANKVTGELDSSDFNKMLTKPIFQWGPFMLYAFCTFYLFCGIAIVCDDFFTASLETLSIKFDLSEDVAGATFMAAGSSAPELFTSLSAVIIKDECANRSSVGIGTIVGSAIFNILVIIGATCMLAGQVLQLGWKPMIRDTCWYALSIALLIIFVLPESVSDLKTAMGEAGCVSLEEQAAGSDAAVCQKLSRTQYVPFDHDGDQATAKVVSSTGLVAWWEGLIMWLAYVGYIVFMHFNEAILGETGDKIDGDEDVDDRVRRKSVAGEDAEQGQADAAAEAKPDPEDQKTSASPELDDDEEDEVDCLGVPKPEELGDKIFTYFSYPWYLIFMVTIPDCETEKWANWYGVSFINSILWIGIICYGMVEFCILIGLMCDISSTVMGLTVLSAGTSVPDAISSIVVAQRGLGDMAISNALGSNVFDILLGLGFPYFLSALKEDQPVMMCVDDVSVYLASLVIVLIIVVGTFSAFKFALRPTMGIILISIYVLFFLMAVLRDQNIIYLGMACDAGH